MNWISYQPENKPKSVGYYLVCYKDERDNWPCYIIGQFDPSYTKEWPDELRNRNLGWHWDDEYDPAPYEVNITDILYIERPEDRKVDE